MADTTVSSAVSTSSDPRQSPWGPYWIDKDIGAIYTASSASQPDPEMWRTTDGGANWTDVGDAATGNNPQFACWFDKETPNDDGTLLHLVWWEQSGTVSYISYDISANSYGTKRDIETGLTTSGFASARLGITKLENGRIIVAYSGAAEIETKKSAETSAPYFATGATDIADVYETATEEDWILLFPGNGDDGDASAIFWDRSANEISVKIYDDSDGASGSWTETSVKTSMTDDSQQIQMDGAYRHSDKFIILAAHSLHNNSDDNLLTFAIPTSASPTVVEKASIFTTQAASGQVGMMINQQNDDVYVAYIKGGTWDSLTDIVYHLSDDDLATWETESAYSEATNDDNRRVMGGRTVGDAGGRWQPVWFNDDLNDLFVNLVNDVEIAAVVAGSKIKTVSGIAIASVKTISGIAIASVKTRDTITNV